jgi:hypothetical protein
MHLDPDRTPPHLDQLMREAMELAARVNRRLSERTPQARPLPKTPPPAVQTESRAE